MQVVLGESRIDQGEVGKPSKINVAFLDGLPFGWPSGMVPKWHAGVTLREGSADVIQPGRFKDCLALAAGR
jgi:hypothetical protein